MDRITSLDRYKDDKGNEIVYDGEPAPKIDIRFQGGSNNRVVVAADADIRDLLVIFTGDNGLIEIGSTKAKRVGLRLHVRIGWESTVTVGEDTGTEAAVFIAASEGEDVHIGRDAMFSRGIELRTDDSHGIYDVGTGERVNIAQSIHVGDHVWLAKHVTILGGVSVGNGSVVGFRSVVTSDVPNNCVAVGSPARVVRRDIAWERPMTPNKRPDEVWPRPGGKTITYWNYTDDASVPAYVPRAGSAAAAPATERWVRRGRKAALRARKKASRVRAKMRRKLGKRRN